MDWTRLDEALALCPVVPVLSVPELTHAEPLARALAAGGITVSEITLRTAAGLPAISAFKQAAPDMVVGAGTLLSPSDLISAMDAGADFAVTPGFDPALLAALSAAAIPSIPGVATAGEAITARSAGLKRVKLFPAESVGGAAIIKALGGPLADMQFMPTGGVKQASLAEYLELANVFAVGGTWVAPASTVDAQDWETVTNTARETLATATAVRP